MNQNTAEHRRLAEDSTRARDWRRWGTYLSERQWATVREDYSANGDAWGSFPHDHARSRAYRWGEDGLLGFTDRQCRLCFAPALWNGRDPILKERLFGLTGPEGNHGEDVKECYYYLDATPTHSYAKALYKYPQAEFPYERLIEENRARGVHGREFELEDTGVFDEGRYFDVLVEYAKAAPEDICIRLTVANRGPEAATLHLLPTLWFRNMWSWGYPDKPPKPELKLVKNGVVSARQATLGDFLFAWEGEGAPLFTDNETNAQRLFGSPHAPAFVKDAFHEAVIHGKTEAVNAGRSGTKFAAHMVLDLAAGEERVIRLRLAPAKSAPAAWFGEGFDEVMSLRQQEADAFYASVISQPKISADARAVSRQAYAGLLWSKQFYYYIVKDWLKGDPASPPPPPERLRGRNHEATQLYAHDVISMPDKWEYPWFAAWDLAFHMIPMAEVDPAFAKSQLILFLREWYMQSNGQIPAYEFSFCDVNPPVHAWAAWRVYKMSAPEGQRDRAFLESVFQKLLINFTWWVNRKDEEGDNLFQGGFLGLDNIGVFDRSKALPKGGLLQQSDGTAWMAFYCLTMLSMALELAQENHVYEDLASKFLEHYVSIADAMNNLGGSGLWDEADGFYYDHLKVDGESNVLRIRSLVGLIPLIAVEILDETKIRRLPGFGKRMDWFIKHRPDLTEHITLCEKDAEHPRRILSIPTKERLERVLRYLLDESEFLSPHGIRSVSRAHAQKPFVFQCGDLFASVDYAPGEATSYLFGGNSNWRGPVWFPINYLLIEALERYAHFYGQDFQVECPVGSGNFMNLNAVAAELRRRHGSIFLPDAQGHRPCHGGVERYTADPHWRDLVLFHEYFHGDNGRGCGASHQTGWTALAARMLQDGQGDNE